MIACPACGFSANPPSSMRCAVCAADLPRENALPRRRPRPVATRSWRRDLLFRRGARPLLIQPQHTTRIGRGPECEVLVSSQRVSRVHAEIVWVAQDLLLRDLGSHNGSRVNGRVVSEATLKDGDELRFGPYTCLYKRLTGVGEAEADLLDDELAAGLDAEGVFAGTLATFTLLEILQTLEVQRRSGTLELVETEGSDGWVAVRAGKLCASECGALNGDEAVFELMRRERGTFRFRPELADDLDENVLGDTLQDLLIDAARHEDVRLTTRFSVAALGDLETEFVEPDVSDEVRPLPAKSADEDDAALDPDEETFPGGTELTFGL